MVDTVDFVEAVPSQCAQMLSRAEVEVALVPIIEYQRIPSGSLIPGVCVGSKEEVRSVVLVSRKSELASIGSVALDESSRTSATLIKIIFREFLNVDPEWTVHSPNLDEMLERYDAALMIGDPAMVFPRTDLKVWDLARLWRNYTGLGFVFAMWMVRDDAIERARVVDFAAARDEGLHSKRDIVDYYHRVLGLPHESLQDYLDNNICFEVDSQLRSGVDLYFQLAEKHGLIEQVKIWKTV